MFIHDIKKNAFEKVDHKNVIKYLFILKKLCFLQYK